MFNSIPIILKFLTNKKRHIKFFSYNLTCSTVVQIVFDVCGFHIQSPLLIIIGSIIHRPFVLCSGKAKLIDHFGYIKIHTWLLGLEEYTKRNVLFIAKPQDD